MTTSPTMIDPKITVHTTPGGKLAVKATTSDGVSKTSYFVGGYTYYVISARRFDRSYNTETGMFDGPPEVLIGVHKRTGNSKVARREALRTGGTVFVRSGGEYREVSL